jgi:hypothetical protein
MISHELGTNLELHHSRNASHRLAFLPHLAKRLFPKRQLQLAVHLPDLLIPEDFNFSIINTSENLKISRITLNHLDFKSPIINTSENKDLKSRRINTSGNKDLKSFVFNTSPKIGVGGASIRPRMRVLSAAKDPSVLPTYRMEMTI